MSVFDIAGILGVCCVVGAVGWMWPPAGLLAAGLALCVIGILGALK